MKEIDHMNTEELRSSLAEMMVKNESLTNELKQVNEELEQAHTESAQYREWWNASQDAKAKADEKLTALKSIVNAL